MTKLGSGLALPAILGVLAEIANLLKCAGGVVPPGRVFPEAIAQEVVGEQPPVLEEFAGEDGVVEDDAKLVELVQGVLVRPGKLPQGPQVQRARLPPIDAEGLGHDLDLVAARGTGLLLGLLVEQDELQGVEVAARMTSNPGCFSPRMRIRSLRTLAVSDFGCTKSTLRNLSSSSASSSIERIDAAVSPDNPRDEGVRTVRRLVSYPRRLRNAARASAEVRPERSLVVRSRSVLKTAMFFQNPNASRPVTPPIPNVGVPSSQPHGQSADITNELIELVVVVISIESGCLPNHSYERLEDLLAPAS